MIKTFKPVKDKSNDPQPDWTHRQTSAKVKNMWADEITQITLRHLRDNLGNLTDEWTWFNVPNNTETGSELVINFETGGGAKYDYWWVKFHAKNGGWFQSKESFRCNLTSSDEKSVVTVMVDAQNRGLEIQPPDSSSCTSRSIEPAG
jgi:hypothetical protein